MIHSLIDLAFCVCILQISYQAWVLYWKFRGVSYCYKRFRIPWYFLSSYHIMCHSWCKLDPSNNKIARSPMYWTLLLSPTEVASIAYSVSSYRSYFLLSLTYISRFSPVIVWFCSRVQRVSLSRSTREHPLLYYALIGNARKPSMSSSWVGLLPE